jgi:hypothetical protein
LGLEPAFLCGPPHGPPGSRLELEEIVAERTPLVRLAWQKQLTN